MMTNRAGIPDELKSPGYREHFSFSLHWESQNKDVAICTYIVNTKSKGKKSVILLSSMRPYFAKTHDDGKEKPQIYKLWLMGVNLGVLLWIMGVNLGVLLWIMYVYFLHILILMALRY